MTGRSARRTVAGLHIAAGAFACVVVGTLWVCAALLEPLFEGTFVPGLVAMFGRPVALFVMALGTLEIAAAVALLRGSRWARIVLLVICVLQLAIFPIGTTIALVTGWLLLTGGRALAESEELPGGQKAQPTPA